MSKYRFITDTSTLKEGDLLVLHSHSTRALDAEEFEHGPSIKLHPAASEHSTRPRYIHGVIYWTVVSTWMRDWVEVISGADLNPDRGWANIYSNSLELCDRPASIPSTPAP